MFITRYILAVMILAGLAIFFALPNVSMIFAIVTMGLGFIIATIPINLLIFSVFLFPAVVLGGGLRWIMLMVGMIAYGGYLVYPSVMAAREAKKIEAELVTRNLLPDNVPEDARRFALRFDSPQPAQLCQEACQALLLTGYADWVQVTYKKHSSRNDSQPSFAFGLVDGSECTDGQDRCVVSIDNPQDPPDIIVQDSFVALNEVYKDNSPRQFVTPGGFQQLEILRRDGNRLVPIYRKVEFTYRSARWPAILVPSLQGQTSAGYEWLPVSRGAISANHFTALEEAGWSLGDALSMQKPDDARPARSPLSSIDLSLVTRILDGDTQNMPFSDADNMAIANYIERVRWFDETPEVHRQLIERIIKEPRFDKTSFLDQVLRGDRELRDRILPWFFDQLESDEFVERRTMGTIFTAMVRHHETAELAPYFDRYVALLESSDINHWGFKAMVGRFGIDPSPYYDAMISPTADGLVIAVRAICNADPMWHDVMAPALWRVFNAHVQQEELTRIRHPVENTAFVLSVFGYLNEVEGLLKNRGLGNESFWKRMNQFDGNIDRLQSAC